MVVIKESGSSGMFWGLSLDGGKRYTQTVQQDFHISMAALEVMSKEAVSKLDSPFVSVYIQHEKSEFLLCTLTHRSILQQPLDLNFIAGEEVTFFLNGNGTVNLTGYVIEEDTMDDSMNQTGMSAMSEDVSDEDDEDYRVEDFVEADSDDDDDESDDDDDDFDEEDDDDFDDEDVEIEEGEDSDEEVPKLKPIEWDEDDDDDDDEEEEEEETLLGKRKINQKQSPAKKKMKADESLMEEELEEDSDDWDDDDFDDFDDDDDEDDIEMEDDGELEKQIAKKLQAMKKEKSKGAHTPESGKKKGENGTPVSNKKIKQDTPVSNKKVKGEPKTPGSEKKAKGEPKTPVSEKKVKLNGADTPATPKNKVESSVETPNTEGKKKKKKKKKNKGKEQEDAPNTPSANTPKGKDTTSPATPGQKTPQANKEKKQKTPKSEKKDTPQKTPKKSVLSGGTLIEEVKEGHGPAAGSGKMVHVYYKGCLKSGKMFDQCMGGKPFKFKLGKSEVIKGWDVGLQGMKVGGKRKITVPASQGYGSQRVGDIPPNSTLVFDVELKAVS